ncbi:MAG: hypothetical protein AB2A00_14470, partial [Myxococcota bacterium]
MGRSLLPTVVAFIVVLASPSLLAQEQPAPAPAPVARSSVKADELYERALVAEQDPESRDRIREEAWCKLARLKKRNPHLQTARRKCRIWRHIHGDYLQLTRYMGLKTRSPDEKLNAVEDFLRAYPDVPSDERVRAAAHARLQLSRGHPPALPVDIAAAREPAPPGDTTAAAAGGGISAAVLLAVGSLLALPVAAVVTVATLAASVGAGAGGALGGLAGVALGAALFEAASCGIPVLGALLAPVCSSSGAAVGWLTATLAGGKRLPLLPLVLASTVASSGFALVGGAFNLVGGMAGCLAAGVVAAVLNVQLASQPPPGTSCDVVGNTLARLTAQALLVAVLYAVGALIGNVACVATSLVGNVTAPVLVGFLSARRGRGTTENESRVNLDLLDVPEPEPPPRSDYGVPDSELDDALPPAVAPVAPLAPPEAVPAPPPAAPLPTEEP